MVEFRHQRIKELRDAHGLTLDEMGKRINKQKQQIGIWENGVNAPSIKNLVLICNEFDVDMSFFLDTVSTPVEEATAHK